VKTATNNTDTSEPGYILIITGKEPKK